MDEERAARGGAVCLSVFSLYFLCLRFLPLFRLEKEEEEEETSVLYRVQSVVLASWRMGRSRRVLCDCVDVGEFVLAWWLPLWDGCMQPLLPYPRCMQYSVFGGLGLV